MGDVFPACVHVAGLVGRAAFLWRLELQECVKRASSLCVSRGNFLLPRDSLPDSRALTEAARKDGPWGAWGLGLGGGWLGRVGAGWCGGCEVMRRLLRVRTRDWPFVYSSNLMSDGLAAVISGWLGFWGPISQLERPCSPGGWTSTEASGRGALRSSPASRRGYTREMRRALVGSSRSGRTSDRGETKISVYCAVVVLPRVGCAPRGISA